MSLSRADGTFGERARFVVVCMPPLTEGAVAWWVTSKRCVWSSNRPAMNMKETRCECSQSRVTRPEVTAVVKQTGMGPGRLGGESSIHALVRASINEPRAVIAEEIIRKNEGRCFDSEAEDECVFVHTARREVDTRAQVLAEEVSFIETVRSSLHGPRGKDDMGGVSTRGEKVDGDHESARRPRRAPARARARRSEHARRGDSRRAAFAAYGRVRACVERPCVLSRATLSPSMTMLAIRR